MLTTRHSRATGLRERDYAQIALAQRRWAATNPGAAYRSPLSRSCANAMALEAPDG